MKTFPKIVLRGNEALASTYIRKGKQELFRTEKLQQQMGVPVYARETELDDGTIVHTLIEKDQKVITIHSPYPEKPPESEELPVEEEEEKEGCQHGFIVYNMPYADYSENPEELGGLYPQARNGFLLTYKKGHWKIEDYSPGGYSAIWPHVADYYQQYYNPELLGECDVLSWPGNPQGPFSNGGDPYYPELGYFGNARPGYIASGGNVAYVSTYSIYGACYLPDPATKKDYFYSLHLDDDNRRFYIFRCESKTDRWEVNYSTRITIASYSESELQAMIGTTMVRWHEDKPYQSASVDRNGIATIIIQGNGSFTSNSASFPNTSGGYYSLFDDQQFLLSGYPDGRLALRFQFNLRTGAADAKCPTYDKSGAAKIDMWRKSTEKSNAVTERLAYGVYGEESGDWYKDGKAENDWARKDSDGDVTYKNGLELVVRKAELNLLERVNFYGPASPVAVAGGCNEAYEYKLRIDHPPTEAVSEGTSEGEKFPNPNYDPENGNKQLKDYPIYPESTSWTVSSCSIKVYIDEYENGAFKQSILISEFNQTGDDGWCRRSKKGDPNKIYPSWDCHTFWRPESPWNESGYYELSAGQLDFRFKDAYVTGASKMRKYWFYHPDIPSLKAYFELSFFAGAWGSVGEVSYIVEHNGGREVKWTRVCTVEEATGIGKPGQIRISGNYWPGYTAGETMVPGDYELSVSIWTPALGTIWCPMQGLVRDGPLRISLGQTFGVIDVCFAYTLLSYAHFSNTLPGIGDDRDQRVNVPESANVNSHNPVTCVVHKKGYGGLGDDIAPYLVYLQHPLPNEGPLSIWTLDDMEVDYEPGGAMAYIPRYDPIAPHESCEFYSNFITKSRLRQMVADKLGEDIPAGFPLDYPPGFGVV